MSDNLVETDFNRQYPSVGYLQQRAKRKMPLFAYEYLSGGANDELNLVRNTSDIQDIELMPQYLRSYGKPDLNVKLFEQEYAAPFGIAPIGLQGLMWPNSAEILAKAATRHGIPFVLSTVTTSDIETVGKITEGRFWFQLYHPAKDRVKDDLLKRAAEAGCQVLVALADTPSFGLRYKDIRNGLSMPPKMSLRNILQIMGKPHWALSTLYHGQPQFANLKPYMPKNLNLNQLGKFMNDTFNGRLDEGKLAALRDQWRGKLVVKGIVNEKDAELALKLGVDGIIVSNHGGRQLDIGESTIKPLRRLAKAYGDKMVVMMDSGIKSGPDVARSIAAGANFTFLGRTFMYGVGALGNAGGNHAVAMLKMQLLQIMDQLGCEKIIDLPKHLIDTE